MQRTAPYTYVELMDDRESLHPEFHSYDLGEGMLFFAHKKNTCGFAYLVNTESEECFELMDRHGKLSSFTKNDVDYNKVEDLEHCGAAYIMDGSRGICVFDFHEGKALFRWVLHLHLEYPYGYADAPRTAIYGVIDKHCNVVEKFRPMKEKDAFSLANCLYIRNDI